MTVKSNCSPGHLTTAMVAALERSGIPAVYLRNYEKLPEEVGNDADILIASGMQKQAARILAAEARDHGWIYLGRAQFSPLAVYFANLETANTLHLDLFDRLEWHFIEFADCGRVLARRRNNCLVPIPAPEDEIYLNLITRLAYQGVIREKHRAAAREFLAGYGPEPLRKAFGSHLGNVGIVLFERLANQDWQPKIADRNTLLSLMLRNNGLCRPQRFLVGGLRYVSRILSKIIRPPGKLIVVEGADGVGKSSVLKDVVPWCSEWCAGREPYEFHWKPTKVSTGNKSVASPVDPRGRDLRPWPLSLVYLLYHISGYWWGWWTRIYPLLIKSHAVVGDRYSYDLFLDPARFRLNLSPAICRLAALMVPKPTVTIGLVADPYVIRARKPELSADEIATYQDRWRSLSAGRNNMVSVTADGTPEQVAFMVKRAILETIGSYGK